MNRKRLAIGCLILCVVLIGVVYANSIILQSKTFSGTIHIMEEQELFEIVYPNGNPLTDHDFGDLAKNESVSLYFQIRNLGISDCDLMWNHSLPDNFDVAMYIEVDGKVEWLLNQTRWSRVDAWRLCHIRDCWLVITVRYPDSLPSVINFELTIDAYPFSG